MMDKMNNSFENYYYKKKDNNNSLLQQLRDPKVQLKNQKMDNNQDRKLSLKILEEKKVEIKDF